MQQTKESIDPVSQAWDQASPAQQREIISDVVAVGYRHAQLAMLVLSILTSTVLAIVVLIRDMPALNLAILLGVNLVFWLYPLALHLLPRSRSYLLVLSWVALVGLVVVAQCGNYLFGPERMLILVKGWPPLVVLAIPLFQVITATFLLREHARNMQLIFLAALALLSVTHWVLNWQQAESVFGMAMLLVTIVLLGPLVMMMLHLQTKVATEVRNRLSVQATKQQLTETFALIDEAKEAQLRDIQNFLATLAQPGIDLPFAQVAAHSETYGALSGDFHFLQRGNAGELNFALCDAMGHDARAGMLTIVAKSVLECIDLDSAPDVWGKLIHRALNACDDDGYITAVLGKLYPDGRLLLAHFGHPASMIMRAAGGEPEQINGDGMALGMFDTPPTCRLSSWHLNRGDTLVLWTDGLIEAMGCIHDQAENMQRLLHSFQGAGVPRAQDLLHRTFDTVYEHVGQREFRDDLSMVCIQYQTEHSTNQGAG